MLKATGVKKKKNQVLSDNNCQPKLQDPVKLSFKSEDKLCIKIGKFYPSEALTERMTKR